VLAALLLTPLCAVAGETHYPDGTRPGSLEVPLEPVESCRGCHGEYDPDGDHEPFDAWSASAMANATRDPVFRASLSVAVQDRPDVGEYCLRCHTPAGWLDGRAAPGDGSGLDPARDLDGVTCDSCHRMIDGTFVRNAIYYMDGERRKHGPRDDALPVGHESVSDPFTGSARLCGHCHHVSSPVRPFLDADGEEIEDSFPLETTYLEWERSAFAASGVGCIDCHMAPAPRAPTSAIDGSPPRDARRHDILGSNAWLGRAVSLAYPELGREAAFERQAERTREFLRTAARLEDLSVPVRAVAGERIALAVRVVNLTGHKLPTGYADGRRMWLEVSIGGRVVSGAYDDEEAELATDPPPRTWEAVHGVLGEGPSFHLARQDTIFSDDRIPPEGFDPTPRTVPVGRSFDGHWDDVRLDVRVPEGIEGEVTLRVRLRHQVLTRAYVDFLRDANVTDDRGELLWAVWDETGRAPPEEIAEIETAIEIDAPVRFLAPAGGGCSAAGGVGGGSAAWWPLVWPFLRFRTRPGDRDRFDPRRSPG
jgi:hypothetical protein